MSRKVLLVDDSPLVRSVAAHTLGAAGYVVTTIDHPEALAAEVTRAQPDLLLVDASYPGLADDTFVALVAPHARSLPVVLFSDRSESELALLAARVGARGSVAKDGATLVEHLAPYFTT